VVMRLLVEDIVASFVEGSAVLSTCVLLVSQPERASIWTDWSALLFSVHFTPDACQMRLLDESSTETSLSE
jgi:hypothetical protein